MKKRIDVIAIKYIRNLFRLKKDNTEVKNIRDIFKLTIEKREIKK